MNLLATHLLATHLRPARGDDCADIYRVHRHAVRLACLQSYNPAVMEAWLALLSPEAYLRTMNEPGKAVWVIEYLGQVQGFFQIDLSAAQLDALYVHPFVHNLGLGTALLNRAEALLLQADNGAVRLYASENSIPFYEINGYRSLGRAAVPVNAEVEIACRLMRKYL